MTEVLKAIFSRSVDRAIEGVIKADDEASFKIELEEYILTNEIKCQRRRKNDRRAGAKLHHGSGHQSA